MVFFASGGTFTAAILSKTVKPGDRGLMWRPKSESCGTTGEAMPKSRNLENFFSARGEYEKCVSVIHSFSWGGGGRAS
jgi:hypothetical protein